MYNELKIKPSKVTTKGRASSGDEALTMINSNFTKKILSIRKLTKLKDTFLEGIINHAGVDGVLHPFFNLHLVKTFRSSADSPNFQNMPIRHPEMKKIIRRAFIPRLGCRFGGVDIAGAEIRAATFYHCDPNMIEYICDKTKDMHRDMAMDCYMLKQEDVTDDSRYCAKNKFVFPQFYGDYYVNCANNLWNAIDQMKLIRKTDSKPLKEYLKEQGIKSYSKFEKHIQDVEDRFWNERFLVYAKWKKSWYKRYLKKGYIDMLTGFRCSGVMSRNDVINYPVQGVSFHLLLWSLIQMVDWLEKEKYETKVIGQIHDEMTFDALDSELMGVLKKTKKVMCHDIREYWDFINVPLDIEAKFSGIDDSWYYKTKVEIPEG